MSKQLSNENVSNDVKVSLKLSDLKPLHVKWIVDKYRKQDDFKLKGFDAAGITKAIKFANDVFTREENPFDEHRQQLL